VSGLGVAFDERRGRRRPRAVAALADFLVEPASGAAAGDAAAAFASMGALRPVVVVVALAPRCGTTSVARALAAELALRDDGGAAIASAAEIAGGGIPLGTPAAGRLGRAVERALPCRVRAIGRVCLTAAGPSPAPLVEATRDLAPIVLDVGDPADAAVAASLADAVVLVAGPAVEPALAAVVSQSLSRVGPEPVVVLNRDREADERWNGRCTLRLPDARMGAQLALAGREARGELGRAVARLADLVAVAQ
jgi:hypothetical protein